MTSACTVPAPANRLPGLESLRASPATRPAIATATGRLETGRLGTSRQDEEDEGVDVGWLPGNARFYYLVSAAKGDFDHDYFARQSERDAVRYRLQVGGSNRRGLGVGLDARFLEAETDRFADTVTADLEQSDVYLFFMRNNHAGPLRLPVRIGPYVHSLRDEAGGSSAIAEYISVGLRLELAPEIVLLQSDEVDITIEMRAAGGLHYSELERSGTRRDDPQSSGYTYDLEAGLRLRLGIVHLDTAVVHSRVVVDEEYDVSVFRDVPRLDTEFTGLRIRVGFRF